MGLVARIGAAQEVTVPPYVHVDRPAVLLMEDGRRFSVPPSYILSEAKMSALDAELKRLQDVETECSTPTDLGGWIQPYLIVAGVGFVLGVVGTVFAVQVFAPASK